MKYTPIAIIVLMLVPSVALASSEVLDAACGFILQFWGWIRTAVYVLAACGLALMSFQASIMGKFSMGNFITWGGSLFLLAMAEPFIAFLTSGGSSLTCAS